MRLFPLLSFPTRLLEDAVSSRLQPPSPRTELGLVYSHLNDADALELSRQVLLAKSHTSYQLTMAIGPKLSIHGASRLAEAMAQSKSLSSVIMKIASDDNNVIWQTMFQGIQRSKTVRRLKISLIGDKNHNVVVDLSQLPTSLDSLRLFFANGSSRDGSSPSSSSPSTKQMMKSLSKGLRGTTSLTELELGNWHWNEDGDDDKDLMMQLLSSIASSTITSLSIQGSLRDAHVALFVEHAWRSDAKLQHLTIDSTQMTKVGMQLLLRATYHYPALCSLSLKLTCMSHKELLGAIESMTLELSHSRLQQLNVDLTVVEDDDAETDGTAAAAAKQNALLVLRQGIQSNPCLHRVKISGWMMHQPQAPLFQLVQ